MQPLRLATWTFLLDQIDREAIVHEPSEPTPPQRGDPSGGRVTRRGLFGTVESEAG